MDRRLSLLLFWWAMTVPLAVLVSEGLSQHIYTNTWAVLVPAGLQEAERMARKHGFLNLGPILSRELLNGGPQGNVRVMLLRMPPATTTTGSPNPERTGSNPPLVYGLMTVHLVTA